ncbi:META domain-containing protein [Streptomyces sp. NPDC012794]|uniref:META domain-containing protein n=1 Tax=Streptomyces sp. NPDC012794 TaxID=3364850 RepID=UPI00368C6828
MRTLRHLTNAALGLVLALTVLALAACGPDGRVRDAAAPTGPATTTAPLPDAPLTATVWIVGSVAGTAAPEGRAARFTLTPDGRASGTLGCNRFSAPAAVDGPTLTLGPLTTTRMACEGPAGELERALTALFGSGPLSWRIQGRNLTLTATEGDSLTAEAASSAE